MLGQACEEGQDALRPSSAADAAGAGLMPGYKLKQLHDCSNLCLLASSLRAFLSAAAQPAGTASWFQLLLLVLLLLLQVSEGDWGARNPGTDRQLFRTTVLQDTQYFLARL